MRYVLLALVATTLSCLGCASTDAADPEHDLRKAETRNAQLERKLRDEQARSLALNDRLAACQADQAAATSEIRERDARIAELEAANAELVALSAAAAAEPLERPDLDAPVLPEPLHAALNAIAETLADRLTYAPARGGVTFANDRLFAPGSAELRPDAVAGLIEFADALAAGLAASEGSYDILVVGHTDADPIANDLVRQQHPTNWHLSVHRAIAVKDVLTTGGLADEGVGVVGFGPYRPVSDVKALNRRIELFVVPAREFSPLTVR